MESYGYVWICGDQRQNSGMRLVVWHVWAHSSSKESDHGIKVGSQRCLLRMECDSLVFLCICVYEC